MCAQLQRLCWLAVVALSVIWPAVASASVPIIKAGREAEVLALFAPYQLGQEVTPGWRLWNVNIRPASITVELHSAAEPPEVLTLTLRHQVPKLKGSFATTQNFQLSYDQPPPESGLPAASALVEALRSNDTKPFWHHTAESDGVRPQLLVWATDPLLLLALLVGLIVAWFAADVLRAPKHLGRLALLAALVGVLLRLSLSPVAALEAWPFSRAPTYVTDLLKSPTLAYVSHERPLYFTELIYRVNFIAGLLGPMVVFIHARRMLGSYRIATIAAWLLAVWPSHLRFSHTDGTLIATLVMSSLGFALVHDALKHPRAAWRWACVLLLPAVLIPCLKLRALNMIYPALFAVVALWLAPGVPWARRGYVIAVLVAFTLSISLPTFLTQHGEQVREIGYLSLPLRAGHALTNYQHNTLIRVEMTPPIALLLATGGLLWLLQRRRRLALFLGGWILIFFVTSAVVLPPEPLMQARYHLHLVVPFILLASVGLDELYQRRAQLAKVAAVLLVLSPLIHLRFIRYVALNLPTEHRFTHSLRPQVPEGCTVLEYGGLHPDEVRWKRVGERFVRGDLSSDYLSVVLKPDDDVDAAISSLQELPCARIYLGLACYTDGTPESPTCAALRQHTGRTVSELTIPSHIYDHSVAPQDPTREHVTFSLHELALTPP